jgi:methionyl-tRNA formyltransferase
MIILAAYRPWALSICNSLNMKNQTVTSNDELFLRITDQAKEIKAIIFIGWSSIIPKNIIDSYLCVCYHPSDLPKYRGGSPIQNQIIDGLKSTFGTLFKMDDSIDSGPIYSKAPLSLEGNMTDIFSSLEQNAYFLVSDFIKNLQSNKILNFVEQNHHEASFCKRRTPEMSEISLNDFSTKSAEELFNKIRSLGDPYPNAFFRTVDGRKLLFKVVDIK